MKRVFVFCLVLLLIPCFIIPASAETTTWIDLLNYGFLFNNYTNVFSFSGDGWQYIDFSLPFILIPYNLDIIVRTDGVIDAASSPNSDLAVHPIGNGYYRIIGVGDIYIRSSLPLGIHVTNGSYFDFMSFRIDNVGTNYYYDVYELYAANRPMVTNANDLYTPQSVTFGSDVSAEHFLVWDGYINLKNWYKYDYIDLIMWVHGASLSSIAAQVGGVNIPYEINYTQSQGNTWSPSPTGPNPIEGNPSAWDVHLRFDLSDVPKIEELDLRIEFQGQSTAGNTNGIMVHSYVGYITTAPINPLIIWFRTLTENLSNYFVHLGSKLDTLIGAGSGAADEFGDTVSDQTDEFNDLSDEFNSVTKPAVEDINTSIDSVVSPNDIFLATSPLSFIFDGNIFYSIFFMSLVLALCAYVLFGKR